jgi:hypothetical protein
MSETTGTNFFISNSHLVMNSKKFILVVAKTQPVYQVKAPSVKQKLDKMMAFL